MKKSTTFNILAGLSIVAACWEMWTIVNRQRGDTFSATIKQLGTSQPFIVFMSGMLCGHLWWPLKDGDD
jgi:hypothetical protein